MKPVYRIWRLNPHKKVIAPLTLDRRKKDFALAIQRMVRASQLGHRVLRKVGDVNLCVACDAGAEEGQPGFRLFGHGDTTAGIAVLFGQGAGGGLVSAPVDLQWLNRHVIWTSPTETDADPVDVSDEITDA